MSGPQDGHEESFFLNRSHGQPTSHQAEGLEVRPARRSSFHDAEEPIIGALPKEEPDPSMSAHTSSSEIRPRPLVAKSLKREDPLHSRNIKP